eukprot:gene11430-13325_t
MGYEYTLNSDSGSGSNDTGGSCYDWITVDDYLIVDPMLVPLCLWALWIGVTRFRDLVKHTDTLFYSIVFLTYGVMMTFAMLADSIIRMPQFSQTTYDIVSIGDVGLTSTVATLIFWCGLSDLNLVNPRRRQTIGILCINILLIFAGWIWGFNFSTDPMFWNHLLYTGVVGVCCSCYLVFQIIYLERNHNAEAIIYLCYAGASGAIGYVIMMYSQSWCQVFGPHLNSSYIWFLMSDVAMILLHQYIVKSRIVVTPNNATIV